MASSSKDLQNLALLVNRVALGLFLMLAGLHKIQGGVGNFYQQGFLGLKPAWLPDWLGWPYGHAVPFAEAVFGAMLLVGWMSRWSAGLIGVMVFSFTVALASAGKFYTGGGPFHTNVLLVTLALLLAVLGPGSLSVDAIWRRRRRKGS